MHHNVLLKCIDQTLKLYSKLNSKDFVGYESGAGYVPGDPRDPVGVRLIRHLISVLTRLVLNVNGVVLKHTDGLLNSIVYLFMGGNGMHDNNMEGVRNLAKPLVEKIFSETGTGNPRYEHVCSSIETSGMAGYYGEMLHLSVAMKRCGSNLGSKRSGMRKSGAIHINGLISTHKLRICCDFRVWRSVGPLLDDTDPDCRREALECVVSAFKCASAGVVSLTSQDHASSSKHVTIVSDDMKMHARKLGLGFASRNIVSGVVRCLTRKNGANDIKRLAVQALRMMAFSGEEFTKSWNDCSVLVSLCKNIELKGGKRADNKPVVQFFAAIENMGLHGMQNAISQDSYILNTLKRYNIAVEKPATLYDVIDEMDDLKSGSPTVNELVEYLPRVWTVLQPICSGMDVLDETNRDSITIIMHEILFNWLQKQWNDCIRDGHENVLSAGRAKVCQIIFRIIRRLSRAGVIGLELIGLIGDSKVVLEWVDFLSKAMGMDLPYLSFIAHPLLAAQSSIPYVLADLSYATKVDVTVSTPRATPRGTVTASKKIQNAISKSCILLELSSSLNVNTNLMQRATDDHCTEVHFLDTYPLAINGRKQLLTNMISSGNFDVEIANSGIVEIIIATMLRDCKTFLTVDRYKVPLPFQPYNNTWAIRKEGLNL